MAMPYVASANAGATKVHDKSIDAKSVPHAAPRMISAVRFGQTARAFGMERRK